MIKRERKKKKHFNTFLQQKIFLKPSAASRCSGQNQSTDHFDCWHKFWLEHWRTSTHKFFLLCRQSERLNTNSDFCMIQAADLSTRHSWHDKSGWRVYTHLLLGVNSTTAKWFRTIGTANNEWVHSLCWYLPNPFIEHLLFWRSSQGFVKTDLYPLYRGLLIYVRLRDTVFSTLPWSTYM